jgi:hypothetical protein
MMEKSSSLSSFGIRNYNCQVENQMESSGQAALDVESALVVGRRGRAASESAPLLNTMKARWH